MRVNTEERFKKIAADIRNGVANIWEHRDEVYDTEKKLLSKTIPELLTSWRCDANKLVEMMNCLYTDRGRMALFNEIFNPADEAGITLIANNLDKLMGCFRNSDEFMANFEHMAKSTGNIAIKTIAVNAIKQHCEDVNTLMESIFNAKHEEAFVSKLTQPQLDTLCCDRRYLIAAFNLLKTSKGKAMMCNKLINKLGDALHDRYDWFNILAGCHKPKHATQLESFIDDLFKSNPALSELFDPAAIKMIIAETIRRIEAYDAQIKAGVQTGQYGKELENYVADNYGEIFASNLADVLFSPDSITIEKNISPELVKKNIEESGKLMLNESFTFRDEVISASSAEEEEANSRKRLCQMADMGREYRNQNINFMQLGGWRSQRYNVGVKHIYCTDNLVDDVLSRLEGYNPKTGQYRPYTMGNCHDQARIQLTYLASTPQYESNLNDRNALLVASPHADHSYLIITRLSIAEIKALPLNKDGRVDIFAIFNLDKDACLLDPWRMCLFRKPQNGLHYCDYPHNDTSQPKVSDPSGIMIEAMCKVGDPNTMTFPTLCYKQDTAGNVLLDGHGDKAIEFGAEKQDTATGRPIAESFRGQVDQLHNDPRWKQHCDRLESRPAADEMLKQYFESTLARPSQPLETYRRTM